MLKTTILGLASITALSLGTLTPALANYVAGCKEMQQSGNCKSELVCDQDQLGAVVCSCNAGRTSRPTSLN